MRRSPESNPGIVTETPEKILTRAVKLTAENREIEDRSGGFRTGEPRPAGYVVRKIATVLLVGEEGAKQIETMLDDLEQRAKKR